MDNQLHPVTEIDYTNVVDVWEASVRATHHFLREEDIQFYKPLILNDYLKAVDLVCLRNDDGKIVGFLGTAADKIEMLFIHPDRRGKGAGKILVDYAINTLNVTKVDVNEANEQAVGFYQHLGFETVSRSALDPMGKPFPIVYMELAK